MLFYTVRPLRKKPFQGSCGERTAGVKCGYYMKTTRDAHGINLHEERRLLLLRQRRWLEIASSTCDPDAKSQSRLKEALFV